jgi:hypothetical protein
MKVTLLSDEELYELLEQSYNPPRIDRPEDTVAFANEILDLYWDVVTELSAYGQEGDFYGISDFAVRPSLGGRLRPAPEAIPKVRQITITIISQKFWKSDFLSVFGPLLAGLKEDYRFWIDTDIGPEQGATMLLTRECAYVRCHYPKEAERVLKVLRAM